MRPGRRPRRAKAPRAQEAEVVIETLGGQGDGVASLNGQPLYVPLALPGEKVRIRTGAKRGDGLEAEVLDILSAAPDRVEPPCPYFGACGGCALQHLAPEAYRAWKWRSLAQTLKRGGLEGVELAPLKSVPAAARRRVSFAVRGKSIGFHGRRSHDLIPIDSCLLLRPELNALIAPLKKILSGVSGVVATVTDSGVDVLLEGEGSPDLTMRERLAAFAEDMDLARLSWRGAFVEPLAARRLPVITFGGVAITPSPGAFLQPSVEGEAILRDAVLAGVGAAEPVADLFCGLGSFTLPLAENGRRVHGVEGSAELVQALKAGADRAQKVHVTAEARDLSQAPLLTHELKTFEALVFDPPRAGAKAQAERIAEAGAPATVVAVSCNPATFLRDARTLTEGGYVCTALTAVDQFPYTGHLEVVGVFNRALLSPP